MNISKLYQRAHALRMRDKAKGDEAPLPEFYVGVALGECVPDVTYVYSKTLHYRAPRVYIVRMALRRLAHKPEALAKTLLHHLVWPEDMTAIWECLLRTYGAKPRLLLAIADGMET